MTQVEVVKEPDSAIKEEVKLAGEELIRATKEKLEMRKYLVAKSKEVVVSRVIAFNDLLIDMGLDEFIDKANELRYELVKSQRDKAVTSEEQTAPVDDSLFAGELAGLFDLKEMIRHFSSESLHVDRFVQVVSGTEGGADSTSIGQLEEDFFILGLAWLKLLQMPLGLGGIMD
jgi:hypothetical protein